VDSTVIVGSEQTSAIAQSGVVNNLVVAGPFHSDLLVTSDSSIEQVADQAKFAEVIVNGNTVGDAQIISIPTQVTETVQDAVTIDRVVLFGDSIAAGGRR
jgi:malonyl CoA-acyl carrier protein transacylase